MIGAAPRQLSLLGVAARLVVPVAAVLEPYVVGMSAAPHAEHQHIRYCRIERGRREVPQALACWAVAGTPSPTIRDAAVKPEEGDPTRLVGVDHEGLGLSGPNSRWIRQWR